jgi:hypothetical protein
MPNDVFRYNSVIMMRGECIDDRFSSHCGRFFLPKEKNHWRM